MSHNRMICLGWHDNWVPEHRPLDQKVEALELVTYSLLLMGRKILDLSVFLDREFSHPFRTLCMSCHGGRGMRLELGPSFVLCIQRKS